MLQKYLDSIKDAPVLRVDFMGRMEDNKKFFSVCKKSFPTLLSELEDPSYVDVPVGWRFTVLQLLAKLEELKTVRLRQVKQKFGSLRVYVDVDNPIDSRLADQLIGAATEEVSLVCEFCGSSNQVSLFEAGYVCNVCSPCTEILCSYTLVNWLLNGKSEQLNDAQLYCLKRLRGEKLPSMFDALNGLQKKLEEANG